MHRSASEDSAGHPPGGDGRFLLCVPSGWDTYISREFYEVQEYLVAQGWTKMVIDEVPDSPILQAMAQAEVVLLWEAYELIERNAASLASGRNQARRIFFCDDVHHFTAHRRVQRLRAFQWADVILATYPDKLVEEFPEVSPQKLRWTPHSAASYFHAPDAGVSRLDKILLSGSRTWPYPFRQFCEAKIPGEICEVVDHPGYPGYPGYKANRMKADRQAMLRVGGEKYGALLRDFPAMLVCGSIFGYLVAKVFEGMAAGCLMLCERRSLGDRLALLGFVDGEHYIGTDLSTVIEDSIEIHAALRRGDQRLAGIVAAARTMVNANHSTTIRATQVHNFCMEDLK